MSERTVRERVTDNTLLLICRLYGCPVPYILYLDLISGIAWLIINSDVKVVTVSKVVPDVLIQRWRFMNLNPSVLLLAKRMNVGLPLSGLLALGTYLMTLSSGVYPGFSAVLSAAAAGVGAKTDIFHPLFALVAATVADLGVFSLPVRLNLLSALCGVFSAMLFYYLVSRMILFCACEDSGGATWNGLSELQDEDVPVDPDVAIYNEWVMRISVAGGLLASFLFVFSVPVWTAATSLNYGLFDLLLLFGSVSLIPVVRTSFSRWMIALSVFLFVLGIFESALFLLLFPLYSLLIFMNWFRSSRRLLILSLITLAGAAAVVFSLYAYRRNMNDTIPENVLDFGITYLHSLSANHYRELRSFIPRSGWLISAMQTGTPLLVLLFGKQILFKERGFNTLIAQALISLVVIPGLLNLPGSPFLFFQPGRHLPVFSYAVLAAGAASAFASCLIFIGPIDKSQDGFLAVQFEKRLYRMRTTVYIFIPLLLLLALATPFRSFNRVDPRRCGFADAVAREMLSVMKDRSWLISNGYLDNHLLIQARIGNKPLVIVPLGAQIGPWDRSRIKQQIVSSPLFEGLNRQRLLNAFSVSPVRFVMEWFQMDREAGNRAMVFATPDIWTECGYQAFPEGLAFGGVRADGKLDLASIDRMNRLFTDRVVPLLEGPCGQSGVLPALCEILRMKAAFACNELGVMLEDANEFESAYQAYQRASQIDPMNISAALNGYTLVLTQNIYPETLDRLKKRVTDAMSNGNIPVQGLMGILQNYGTVRHPAYYQQQAAMWQSIGSRTISSEKIRKAVALAGQVGASMMVQNALVCIHAGDYDKAKVLYLSALEQNETNKEAFSGLCTLLLNTHETDEAEELIKKALSAGINKDELLYQIITLAILKGNTEQALEHLESATKKYPSDPRYWSLMADILLNQEETLVVEQVLLPQMQQALNNPDHCLVHAVRGFLLRKKGIAYYKDARLSLLKAVNINAAMPDVWNAVFELDIRLGNLDFAETDAQLLLNIEPDNALANYLLGATLLKRGMIREAEDFLRRSIEKKPTAAACNDLADNLRLQKKLAEAESVASQALQIQPDLLPALDTLASVFADAGKYDEAVKTALRALDIKGDYAPAQLTLLRTKVLEGDSEGVRQRLLILAEKNISIPEVLQSDIKAMNNVSPQPVLQGSDNR